MCTGYTLSLWSPGQTVFAAVPIGKGRSANFGRDSSKAASANTSTAGVRSARSSAWKPLAGGAVQIGVGLAGAWKLMWIRSGRTSCSPFVPFLLLIDNPEGAVW